jgi:flagellum-specific peptidoglycan hydrolase FlgJ
MVLLGFGLRANAPALAKPQADTATITVDNLARELQRQGIVYWRVVLAQAIVETGWEFNSALYRQTNNFIGMRIPGSRPSTRSGEHRGYSKYARWQDCVADIKIWQDHFWKGGTRDQYIAKLHRVWAQAPDYAAHLHKLVREFDERFPEKA